MVPIPNSAAVPPQHPQLRKRLLLPLALAALLGCGSLGVLSLGAAILAARSLGLPSATVIEPRARIPVVCRLEPGMFPMEWQAKSIDAQAEPLRWREIRRSQSAVLAAMSAYPPPLLARYLERVYVARSLSFRGVTAAGTSSRDRIYIADDGLSAGFDDRYLAETFHHEFAHILQRENPALLDREAWAALNGRDFHYAAGGVQSIKQGRLGHGLDEPFLTQGFFGAYPMSSLDEDFAVTAEHLFLDGAALWPILDSHPLLAKKVALVIRFYAQLDPELSELHFRTATPLSR